MAWKNISRVYVRDIVSLYSNPNMIKRFHYGIGFSNKGHEEDVILEPCSEIERVSHLLLIFIFTYSVFKDYEKFP